MQNQPNKIMIGSDQVKQLIIQQIRRLLLAIQIEKTCDKKIAGEDIIYFLKQIIYLVDEETKNKNQEPLDKS